MIICVCGPLGFEKAEKLYKENREQLEGRFAGFFLRQFEQISESCISEEELKSFSGMDKGRCIYCEIKEGGLMRALWNIAEELDCGLDTDLFKIPVRQEVIEILELFDESPYECCSEGCFAVAMDEGSYESLTENEMQHRIIFTPIECTADSKARIIRAGGFTRFLTPPARQDKDILDRQSYNK